MGKFWLKKTTTTTTKKNGQTKVKQCNVVV
jgi:hypothetical protein